MNTAEKSFTFVVVGDESYGTSRFITSYIELLLGQGRRVRVLSFCEGAIVVRCRKLGADTQIVSFDPPPNYTSGGLASVVAVFRLVSWALRNQRLLRSALAEWVGSIVIVRTPNLVPIVAVSSRLAGTRGFWILPNDVSSRYPLHLNKLVYELLFFTLRLNAIANSQYTLNTLLGWSGRTSFTHLGVDASAFYAPSTGRANILKIEIPTNAVVFGIFARLTPEKGQLEFIEALASLSFRAQMCHVIVCGGPLESEYGRKLRELSERQDLCGRVHLVGEQADVLSWYTACDVVVNSRLTAEPFGLSIIEGMLMSRPVLAHAAGGPSETIVDGKTGWLVNEATVDGFAKGIERVLQASSELRGLGEAARRHALDRFEIGVTARCLDSIYYRARE